MKLQEILDCRAANLEENWTNKSKKSITCSNPTDFRERANRAETGIIYETTDQPLPTKVYHVSRKRNRGSILKLGLAPKTKEHTHILRKPGVFAFETLEQAQDWAWNWAHEAKEPMDIWEVNVRNSGDLQPDPSREMQEIYDCWVIYKPVPVTDLRLSAIQPIPQGFFYKTSNPKKLRYLQELGHLSEPNSIHKAIPQMKQSASHPRSVSEAVKGDEITRLLGNADQNVKDWARQQQWVMATIAFPGISGDKLPNEQQVKYYQQKLIRGESVPPAVMGPDGKLIAGIDQAQAAASLSLKVLVWLPKSSPSISEAWTKKYKRSIDCSKPRGFSQQAHCAGRKKRQAGGKTKSASVRENRMDTLVESMLTQLTAQGLTEAEAVSHIDERLDEDLRKWFKQKWVRFGPDGRIRGACARGSEGEGKPKCLPQKKAWSLGKKRRATAAARKRRQDPNPEREGKAKNVATKESVGSTKLGDLCTIKTNFPDADFWLVRRSDRKNVGKPTKEFSPYHIGIKVTATEQLMPQYLYYMMMHLHNQGYWQTRSMGTTALLNIRTEDVKNIQLALTEHELKENSSCPHCGGHMVNYSMLSEKQDACYYKVKSRYKVWPSAYASGALVQCRKKGAANWGNKGKKR